MHQILHQHNTTLLGQFALLNHLSVQSPRGKTNNVVFEQVCTATKAG